jgi:hypothetical protein
VRTWTGWVNPDGGVCIVDTASLGALASDSASSGLQQKEVNFDEEGTTSRFGRVTLNFQVSSHL